MAHLKNHPAVERVTGTYSEPASVGESPVWRANESTLYWVDIASQKIIRQHVESGLRNEWMLPEKVACISFDRHGNVLAGMESGLFAIVLPTGSQQQEACSPIAARKLAAPVFAEPDMRFNDGRCDRQGRFWAGTMVQDMAAVKPVGALYCFDTQGCLSAPKIENLIVQNGLSWSPDGCTMYLSDSHPSRRLIWAFDYNGETGEMSRRRVFADLHHFVGRPDGAAIDEDGCYWICANDAACVLRFTPDGRLDRSIELPVIKPSMCAFGGSSLETLYITSIRSTGSHNEHDGHVFAVRPGVRGYPESEYAGAL